MKKKFAFMYLFIFIFLNLQINIWKYRVCVTENLEDFLFCFAK